MGGEGILLGAGGDGRAQVEVGSLSEEVDDKVARQVSPGAKVEGGGGIEIVNGAKACHVAPLPCRKVVSEVRTQWIVVSEVCLVYLMVVRVCTMFYSGTGLCNGLTCTLIPIKGRV